MTDIFAYDVKPEVLYEGRLSFPARFMADILFIAQKRLPLRLDGEEADFDKNADKYHVHDSSSTRNDRKQRTSEDVEVRGTKSDFDSRDGPAAEAAVPESEATTEAADSPPEPPIEAAAVNEDDTWAVGGSIKSLNKKEKREGRWTVWK